MTDLEITKLCADALGLQITHIQGEKVYFIYHPMSE